MDNEKDTLEIDLDKLMDELQDQTAESPLVADDTASLSAIFSSLAQDPPSVPDTAAPEEAALPSAPEAPEQTAAEEQTASDIPDPTQRLDSLSFASEPTLPGQEPTIRIETDPEASAQAQQPEPQPEEPEVPRSVKIRELKRKLVAGPEKRYYALNEQGVIKLQLGMLCNLIVLILCCVAIGFFTADKVPANRMKLLIFSQVIAMLVSGTLGSSLLLDGLWDMFRLRYSLNSTLVIAFLACCADAWFCLSEQRVPCCAAFVLAMSMAMLARYHQRVTEMEQLDTLRKASHLTSLVKEPKFYEKRSGILRGQGDVEDFMDTYDRISTPEIVQRVFAFIALIASVGIAVLAGLLHGGSMAVQIFSTTLLVSVPASYFISLTRPARLLQKRLHMVGAVICGWQGVRKLCGKAVFPLRDKDLFPKGSTKLNGIKFYSEYSSADVVSYTASLIFAAGGGLVPLFRNLLNSRNGKEYPVENFRDYGEGGIGGEVCGESVLLGNLEFLQSMGVEIPQGTMVNQAVYVAIDGELAAVIAISYSRMRSAAAGLVSLCGSWRLRPMLLAGDFMLTDSFIRDKFSIRTRRLITPPRELRSQLAAQKADPEAAVLALVTRDDLVSSAYAVTGSMALRTACLVGSVIHILGGIVGIVIMLALAYLGYTEYLTPERVLLYQLVWMLPGFLASEWTRTV